MANKKDYRCPRLPDAPPLLGIADSEGNVSLHTYHANPVGGYLIFDDHT